jgi:hypothetical protein
VRVVAAFMHIKVCRRRTYKLRVGDCLSFLCFSVFHAARLLKACMSKAHLLKACVTRAVGLKSDLARAASCPTIALQNRTNCTAMQHLSWNCTQDLFARLDQPIWHIILNYLWASPKHRDNGLARCNRACNIVWRRMIGSMIRRMLSTVIQLHHRSANRAEWNRTRGLSLRLFCDMHSLCGGHVEHR